MAEAAIVDNGSREIVTSQNMHEYINQKMGIVKDEPVESVEPSPEEKAAEELAKIDAKKKDEEDPTHELDESVPKDKKSRLNERFSELTTKRKEAEARAEKAVEEAKILRQEREQLASEAKALKDKYEPAKPETVDPEPDPTQFNDVKEYSKALKEWTSDNVRREDSSKRAQEKVVQEATAKQNEFRARWQDAEKAIPDFKETLAKAMDLTVSNEAQSAIMDSEVGPEICYYLAKNPDEVSKMSKLPIDKMLKYIGKLEDKVAVKTEGNEAKPVAKVSSAPAPISPMRSGASTGTGMLDAENKFMGTYADWKKARSEGKIK